MPGSSGVHGPDLLHSVTQGTPLSFGNTTALTVTSKSSLTRQGLCPFACHIGGTGNSHQCCLKPISCCHPQPDAKTRLLPPLRFAVPVATLGELEVTAGASPRVSDSTRRPCAPALLRWSSLHSLADGLIKHFAVVPDLGCGFCCVLRPAPLRPAALRRHAFTTQCLQPSSKSCTALQSSAPGAVGPGGDRANPPLHGRPP